MFQEKLIKKISDELKIEEKRVTAAVELLDDDKTIPFIARYRKEMTESLNEIQLRLIAEKLAYLRKLEERRSEIIDSIESQDKMTEEIRKSINGADNLSKLEDIYLPFKKRKKTRADKARERGLDPLKNYVLSALHKDDKYEKDFVELNEYYEETDITIIDSLDILREEISINTDIRDFTRKVLQEKGYVETEQDYGEDEKQVYSDFYSYKISVRSIPNHRVMAMNRGEKEGVIKVRIKTEFNFLEYILKYFNLKRNLYYFDNICKSVSDGIDKLLLPSIEREIRNSLSEKAEERAINVFSKNLRNLLLTPPLKKNTVLGIDPGFRTGCKCAVVDSMGNLIDHFNIYPNQPRNLFDESKKLVIECIKKHDVDIISIGNGTASRETEEFVSKILKGKEEYKCSYVITSEAGASVYSASENAIEEFTDLDLTTRGAISIARRIQDPLAEFVKIPPESIGVGMYQHDVNSKKLKESLKREVESVVNYVGVDINTASAFLLQYISGLNKKSAWNIVEYRKNNGEFKNRKQLLKVKGIGAKAYEQAAGFCRVPDSDNPLDNTIIHPESYGFCEEILEYLGVKVEKVSKRDDEFINRVKEIDEENIGMELKINIITVKDIKDILSKESFDPRDYYPQPILKKEVKSVDDLKEGMRLQGTVRNVVDFGAFVDIGVKIDGLIHVSHMGKRRVDPLEVLYVGQIIEVEVIKVEKNRNRIGLSLIK